MGKTRKIAAYHECGHAVVALALGESVRCATIKPRAGFRGQVTVDGRIGDCETALLITLAGPFAHRRFAPRSNWATRDFSVVDKMIFGKASKCAAVNKERYLAHVVDLADWIVDYLWADIRVAAKALHKHETLTGDEICAVIRAGRRKSGRRCRIGDPPAFALTRAETFA